MVNYLQNWLADRIAEKIQIKLVSKPSKRALRKKNTLAGEYIAMRTAYGIMHHWPLDETGVDIDQYDLNPHTYYFLALQRSGLGRKHLNTGLRLTQVHDFNDSLSLSMWEHAVDKQKMLHDLVRHKQDIAILKKAAQKGHVWDLTRLVTHMSLQAERPSKLKRATYVALLVTLGAAMRQTGGDAFWIFTTNRETKRFMDRMGIQYTMLTEGRIGYSDAGDSYFGWTSAPAAYEQLKHGQPIVAQLVERGYTQGATPQSGADSVS
jgi:N-acyl-L-homoserine lactone synthetase